MAASCRALRPAQRKNVGICGLCLPLALSIAQLAPAQSPVLSQVSLCCIGSRFPNVSRTASVPSTSLPYPSICLSVLHLFSRLIYILIQHPLSPTCCLPTTRLHRPPCLARHHPTLRSTPARCLSPSSCFEPSCPPSPPFQLAPVVDERPAIRPCKSSVTSLSTAGIE